LSRAIDPEELHVVDHCMLNIQDREHREIPEMSFLKTKNE